MYIFNILILCFPGSKIFHREAPRGKFPAAPVAYVQRSVQATTPNSVLEECAIEVVLELLRHPDMEDQRLLGQDGGGKDQRGDGTRFAPVLY